MSVLHPLSTIHDFPPSEGWPGAEQELLLQAALLNSSTAVGAWNQWLSRIDLHKLGAASRSFFPFVHKNLQEYDDVIDTAISRYIKTVHLEIYARNRKLFTQIAPLLQELHQEGFRTIMLKGAALAHLYYSDIGFRSMTDIDLLIPSQQVHDGFTFLQQHGWRPVPRFPEKFSDAYVRIIHGYPFHAADDRAIDFHWHVMHECCQPDSDRDFWDHAIPFNFQGIETLALCPADQLLHICVHSARFGSNTRLRWVADVMVILQNSPSDIDWNRLILQAKTRRLILPVRETLTYVKTRFNAPVPEDALQELDTVSLTPVDLFEYRYKRQNYHKKPLGYLPILWFDHCRLTGSVHFLRKLLGFPGYLQQFWGSETTRHALIFLLTACKQRLAAWQARRDATPDVYRPPGVTKPNLFRTSIRRFSGNTDRKKSVSIRVIRVIRVLFFYKKAVGGIPFRGRFF